MVMSSPYDNVSTERHERQLDMIFAFADLLENPPQGIIHDTSHLPCSKNELIEAFCEQIEIQNDPMFVTTLHACGLHLADYQTDVGAKSLSLPSIDEVTAIRNDPTEIDKLAESFSDGKLGRFTAMVAADRAEISAKLDAAKAKSASSMPRKKSLWDRIWAK